MRTNTYIGIAPRGFTIFFATLVTSLALAIGVAIYDLTVRELSLSATVNESQQAIYAADTGAECALYWDTKCTLSSCQAGSVFATSSETDGNTFPPPQNSGLNCDGSDISAAWTITSSASAATTTFTVVMATTTFTVTVAKSGTPTRTVVAAHGQFNCAAGTSDCVERVLQVSY